MSRPRGDRDLDSEQFFAALAAAHRELGPRRRGHWSEIDLAATIGISRRCLYAYRRIYGVPRSQAIVPTPTVLEAAP